MTSTSPRWKKETRWRLSESPVLEIGKQTSDSLQLFNDITALLPLTDGRIVVANQKPLVVRVYSANGEYINDVGRRGMGPGEYKYFECVFRVPGDSILVATFAGKAMVFASDGQHGRAVVLAKPPRDYGEFAMTGFAPIPIASFGDGTFLTTATVTPVLGAGAGAAPNAILVDSMEFHHYSAAGARLNSLGVFDHLEWSIGSEVFRIPSPERVFATGRNRLYTGNGASFEILAVATDGMLKEIFRIGTPAVPFTSDSISKRRGEAVSAAATPERRFEIEKRYSVSYPRDSLPRFRQLIAPEDGGVWAQEYPTVAINRWYVFDSDGSWLGALELPPRFSLKAVAGDLAYGVALDADDVESIRVYRIIKSGG